MLRPHAWLALALVALASPARADDNDAGRAHFQVGQSYYDEANYTDALKAFKEAHRLTKKPALHYNIALCHERLDQLPEAIAALEAYLTEVPGASDRKLVESRIANLKSRVEKEAQAATEQREREARDQALKAQEAGQAAERTRLTQPPERPATPAPAPRKRIATWVVGALGLGLIAGAAITGGLAQAQYNDVSKSCPMDACTSAVSRADLDRGKRLAVATDVMWPIGVAAVGVAVALFFVEGRPKADKPRVSLAPFLSASGGGLTLVATH